MPTDSIIARYRIETCLPLEQVAETIAGEQSSGTFLPIPGETEELKARARAKVIQIAPLDSTETPALPGGRRPKVTTGPLQFQRAEITLEFPFANLGANLPTLLATVCGNLYELSDHTGCKLLILSRVQDETNDFGAILFKKDSVIGIKIGRASCRERV